MMVNLQMLTLYILFNIALSLVFLARGLCCTAVAVGRAVQPAFGAGPGVRLRTTQPPCNPNRRPLSCK